MSRIASTINLVKNLPATAERHNLIKQLITVNIGVYAYYLLSSGPNRLRLKRDFTLQPESGPQALFTYHFVHTKFWPLVFNCGVLATVGSQLIALRGANNFLRLLGIGAAGSALFAGLDVRHNAN
jgi:membrane associated rhomboid family serine protease